MCKKILPAYANCGHSASANPDFVIAFIDKCDRYDCPGALEKVENHEGSCPACLGEHNKEQFWYKHCYQSNICEHEYDHMVTDVERDSDSEDVVLVTPEFCELCPDCKAQGYDNWPGGINPAPRTPSRMPRGYEGLSRRPMDSLPVIRSKIPSTMVGRSFSQMLGQRRVPPSMKMSGALLSEFSDEDEDEDEDVSPSIMRPMDSSRHSRTSTQVTPASQLPPFTETQSQPLSTTQPKLTIFQKSRRPQ